MNSPLYVGLLLALLVAMLGAYCAYLKKAQDALRAVSPPARRMRPGQVWLMLIPIFSFGYSFIFAKRLAQSISADLRARGGGAGRQKLIYDIGLAMSLAQLTFLLPSESMWALLGQFVWAVLWIIHWVGVVEAEKKLRTLPVLSTQEGQVFAE